MDLSELIHVDVSAERGRKEQAKEFETSEEERQTIGEIRAGEPIGLARPHVARLLLDTEQETRARQDRFK